MSWGISLGELINALILIGTAYIVWIYTKAAQRSNDIQEQPIINLLLQEENNGANTFYTLIVRNAGRAPAYNITFLPLLADDYVYRPYFRKEASPILEPEDERELHFWVHRHPNITEAYERVLGFQRFLMRFFPDTTEQARHEEVKRTAAIFVINYESANGKKYHSVFRVYSKIWALLGVYDMVAEFIEIAEGHSDAVRAKDVCAAKPTIPKFPGE